MSIVYKHSGLELTVGNSLVWEKSSHVGHFAEQSTVGGKYLEAYCVDLGF